MKVENMNLVRHGQGDSPIRIRVPCHPCMLRGATLVETIVACVLVTSVMSVFATAVVRAGRLQQSMRHERLAMDEADNQLAWLVSQPTDRLSVGLAHMQPSEILLGAIPLAQVSGRAQPADQGLRVTVRVIWNPRSTPPAQVARSTWVPLSPGLPTSGSSGP